MEAEKVIRQRNEYINELRAKMSETETEKDAALAEMKRKMGEAGEKFAKMEKSLENIKKERDEAAQKLVEEINRAGSTDPQYTDRLVSIMKERNTLQQELSLVKGQLEAATEDASKKTMTINDLSGQKDSLAKAHQSMLDNITQKEKEVMTRMNDAENRIRSLEAELTASRAEAKSLGEDLTRMRSELAATHQNLAALNSQHEALKDYCNCLLYTSDAADE